jgi:hypothetical protein
MGNKPARKSKPKSTAAKKKAVEIRPNFTMVGEPRTAVPALLDLVLYSEVVRYGSGRWKVRARFDEWVGRSPHHVVWMLNGSLRCDCRQGIAGRVCAHVVAVRHLGVMTAKAAVPEQIRMFPNPVSDVRFVEPERKRTASIRIKAVPQGSMDARLLGSAYRASQKSTLVNGGANRG